MNETTIDVTTRDETRLRVTRFVSGTPDRTPAAGAPEPRDVLLLHGWPNAGRVWRPLAEALLLGDPSLRLFAPDLRGYGDSDKPDRGYDCETFASDVEDVAAGLALDPYTLIGHSMSGKIVQLVASRQPASLAAQVLVTPGPLAASPPIDVTVRQAMYAKPARIRDMITGWAAHSLSADVADVLTEDALRVGQTAWNAWLATMRSEDFADRASAIAVPTLVVGGGRDPQRTEEELRRGVVQRIAGSEYVRLPNSGHLPHVEEPAALAALVVNFLDDRMPAGAAVAASGTGA